jgi:histone deacetylase HOS3
LPEYLDVEDLYVCPQTIDAVKGCLGSIYNAIDNVCGKGAMKKSETSFCVIRPPGHHGTKQAPMGFCFINNIIVGCIYAHKIHHIQRIAILDIDLHHGNGTQEFVKELNKRRIGAETKKTLTLFYGSMHDILSYPCETKQDTYIDAASICLMDHDYYIWNVHLDSWKTMEDFEISYHEKYSQLWKRAERFFKGYDPEQCLIMLSAGFDAHEMELKEIQRYGKNVPNIFYHRFTTDVMKVAERCCEKKIVSILEGGYSDQALMHASCGHIGALMSLPSEECVLPNGFSSSSYNLLLTPPPHASTRSSARILNSTMKRNTLKANLSSPLTSTPLQSKTPPPLI